MAEDMRGDMQGPEMQEGMQQEVDPRLQKEVDSFVGGISKMLHSKETKGMVYKMLQSAPPEKSIPEAVLQTNIRLAEKMKQKSGTPSIEALFAGTLFATSELAEIGNAGGFFEQELGEETLMPVVQASLQKMIEEGVRRQMIDPIELQEKVEPMLSEQQRSIGLEAGAMTGVPAEAGPGQAMEQYANQRVQKERAMLAQKQSAENRKGMVQQVSRGGA
jgi:hypothetical protein